MQRIPSFLIAFCLFITAFSAQAQKEETVIGHRGMGLSGIWGGSKHQLTQFGDSRSYINGGYFGLEFGKSLFIGFGHYELEDDVKWDDIQNQAFDLRWRPVMLQYGFKNYKPVHPQIGVDIGGGKITLDGVRDRVLVVQPTAGIEFNIFRWLHLGIDGGYRFVNDSSIAGLSNEDLSGFFGQATLKFGFSWGRYNKKPSNGKPKHHDD